MKQEDAIHGRAEHKTKLNKYIEDSFEHLSVLVNFSRSKAKHKQIKIASW